MRSWSERSLGNLEDIHPHLRMVCDRALQLSVTDFTVIEGLRTLERQKQLKAEGFSRTLKSRHLTGHAVDVVPFPILWPDPYPHETWVQLANGMMDAAEELNVDLEWGFEKWGWDKPHFQLSWRSYPV